MPLPPAPGTRSSVTAGMRWDGVSVLRRLLIAEGDLAADSVAEREVRYVPPLVRAVQRYQRRHGLDADGDLGPTTRAVMAQPLASRIRALELSLERWRWMPRLSEQTSQAPLVLVNIPAFRLYAFHGPVDDETHLLSMNVVVGKALDSQTPVFADTLSSIVFAPSWDVPESIAEKEIWPKARADASYLARNHYEVVKRRYIRQKPGPWNALGKVKFLFPNDYAIYMHDTPSRRSFRQARRDASHGCIRLDDPRSFARWLLPDTTTWSDRWLDEALARDTSLVVQVPQPRPVLLMYATAMARQNGETEFYPDIYGHDRTLWARIAQGYPRAR
jgi:murein L,D-transpeptidase YcbB/YkuD